MESAVHRAIPSHPLFLHQHSLSLSLLVQTLPPLTAIVSVGDNPPLAGLGHAIR